MYLLPNADMPVFQVSMPHDLTVASAYQLGQALAPMRVKGVLILGSGSMTHNLYEFRQIAGKPADYAVAFTQWVRQTVQSKDAQKLIDCRHLAPQAQRAHSTEEMESYMRGAVSKIRTSHLENCKKTLVSSSAASHSRDIAVKKRHAFVGHGEF